MAKMQIKRVGVLSVAKISGIVGAALGLFVGLIYGLIFFMFGAAMMAAGPRGSGPARAACWASESGR